jgi:hypothetical protein
LFIPTNNNKTTLLENYGKEVNDKFYATKKFITETLKANVSNGTVNQSIALSYQLTFKKVSKSEDADITISKVSPDRSDVGVIYIPTNPQDTHPLSRNQLLSEVQKTMKQANLVFTPIGEKTQKIFNSHVFDLYAKSCAIKSNSEYTFCHKVGKASTYTYSNSLVQKIINDITDDPDVFVKIKNKKS